MPRRNRGVRLLAAPHAFDKVAHVRVRAVLDGLHDEERPPAALPNFLGIERPGPWARTLFFVDGQLRSVDDQRRLRAAQRDAVSVVPSDIGLRVVDRKVAGVFKGGGDRIGAVPVFQFVLPSQGHGRDGYALPHVPLDGVNQVGEKVRESAAAVVPEETPLAEAKHVEGTPRGRTQPLFPIQALRGAGGGLLLDLTIPFGGILVPPSGGQGDLAQAAGGDNLPGADKVVPTPVLRADLDDAAGFLNGLNNLRTFFEPVGHRLFAVDVLSGADAVDDHRHVPVVRGADHNAVDLVGIEKLLIIGEGLGLAACQLSRLFEIFPIDVTYGRDLNVGGGLCRTDEESSAAAGPDDPQPDSIVCAQDFGPWANRRRRT